MSHLLPHWAWLVWGGTRELAGLEAQSSWRGEVRRKKKKKTNVLESTTDNTPSILPRHLPHIDVRGRELEQKDRR